MSRYLFLSGYISLIIDTDSVRRYVQAKDKFRRKSYIDNVEVGGRVRQLVVVGGPDGPDM